MNLRLFFILFISCISQNIKIYSGESEISVGLASHIGDRGYQEDRAMFKDFIANGVKYHLAMVCDGHGDAKTPDYNRYGGSRVSMHIVNHLGNIIEDNLKKNNSNVKNVLLESFAQCEKNILEIQKETDKNQPGSTVVLSLLDLTNHKRYIANLGDSRLFIYNNYEEFKEIFRTEDHTCKDELEKQYINTHGGKINRGDFGQQGVFLKENSNGLKGIETPRALGDSHLKVFTAEDGTVGPVNPVPDIIELELNKDELEIIVSDGFTKEIDYPEGITLDECLKDIINLSDEIFYKKYGVIACFTTCSPQHTCLYLGENESFGNDDILKIISRRLIYLTRYISQSHASLDNTTVLVQRVNNLPPLQTSIINRFVNRYSLCALGVILFSLIYYKLYR